MTCRHGNDPEACVRCSWYRCGVCGEGCEDFPRFEHAGRCFPPDDRLPRPSSPAQLALFP